MALTAMVAIGCKSSPKETVYDVYVAGSEAHDPFWKTVLWVNGKPASAPSADGGLKLFLCRVMMSMSQDRKSSKEALLCLRHFGKMVWLYP